MKKDSNLIAWIIIILILLGVIILFSYYSHKNYSTWKDRHTYFKNPNPQIESWMSTNIILNRFNVNETALFNELNLSKKDINPRSPLDQICKEYKINCTSLVQRLNELNK